MGLVANVIEDAAIPTACVSLIPPLTRATGAPRVMGIVHPMGLPFGLPHDAVSQRDLLHDVLEATAAIDEPRGYVELPHQWPERRAVAIREPATPPPIARLLTKKPWLLPRLVAGKPPEHAKARGSRARPGDRT